MKANLTFRQTLISVALASTSTLAIANENHAHEGQQVKQLEQRVDYLESLLKDQNKVLNQKTADNRSNQILEFSGLIEVEASHVNPDNGDSENDLAVATVELGGSAEITDQLSAELVLLYEEDETDLEVDVAQLTYAFANSPISLTAGQLYLPFGAYETGLVSDPLTLDIGETRETAFVVGLENAGISGAFYLFNGDNSKGGDNTIDNWGANLAYSGELFSASLGYINDLGDSDTIQDSLSSSDVADYTAGISANAVLGLGPVTLLAEYTAALDEFGSELEGAKPSASNLEINYQTQLMGKAAVLAAAYQTSDEALALELPETRLLIGIGFEINDHFGIGIEYAVDSDYEVSDGGSGEDTSNAVVQLAVSF